MESQDVFGRDLGQGRTVVLRELLGIETGVFSQRSFFRRCSCCRCFIVKIFILIDIVIYLIYIIIINITHPLIKIFTTDTVVVVMIVAFEQLLLFLHLHVRVHEEVRGLVEKVDTVVVEHVGNSVHIFRLFLLLFRLLLFRLLLLLFLLILLWLLLLGLRLRFGFWVWFLLLICYV